jgi:hypothetical protein
VTTTSPPPGAPRLPLWPDASRDPSSTLTAIANSLDREAAHHLREAARAEAEAADHREAAQACTHAAEQHRTAAASLPTTIDLTSR